MNELLNAKRNADKRYFEGEMSKFCGEHFIGMQYAAEAEPWTWRYIFTKYVPTDDSGDSSHILMDTTFLVDYKNDSIIMDIVNLRKRLRRFFKLDCKSYYPTNFLSSLKCYPQSKHNDQLDALIEYERLKQSIISQFEDRYASKNTPTTFPEIKNVIFQNPATIVFWTDGTKTVVKAKDEAFDEEKGLAMAISKKAMGNKYAWKDGFRKWLPEIEGDPVEDGTGEAKYEERTLADEIEYYLHEQLCIRRDFGIKGLKDIYVRLIRHFVLDHNPDLQIEMMYPSTYYPGSPLCVLRINDYKLYFEFLDIEVRVEDRTNFYNKAADKICQIKDHFGLD